MIKPLLRLKNVKEKHYKDLAEQLCSGITPTSCIALHGDLGAGKTSFARCFIRHYLNDETAEIPSPTFTLIQHYPSVKANTPDIYHYDFYRLENENEVQEIGFEDNLQSSISLVEWPEKIQSHLPQDTLFIQFADGENNNCRTLTFLGTTIWQSLLDKVMAHPALSSHADKG